MEVFSVIKYEGPNDVLVWKSPKEDFTTKSQLIVHESQEALLFKNGQALDLYGPGTYTLTTKNIPLLQKIVNLPFDGESPFHCEVFFINKIHSMDVKWGTSNPIPVQDPTYNIILPVSANGQFAIQVEDSRKLIVKLVGTISEFTQDNLIEYFRGILMSHIKDALAKCMGDDKITFLEVQSHLRDLSDGMLKDLTSIFSSYGIKLINFNIMTIAIPEDNPSYIQLKDTLAQKAAMDVMGYTYQEKRTFDVLESAAKNEGGGGGSGVMGAGLGLGMGVNMGGYMGQALGQNLGNIGGIGGQDSSPQGDRPTPPPTQPTHGGQTDTSQTTCPNCGRPVQPDERFCGNCGTELIDSDKVVCANCGKLVTKNKFCSNCGQPLEIKKICPVCGEEVTTNFCPKCGTKIEG